MLRLTFALAHDGLMLPALVGLNAPTMQSLQAQGILLPRPLQVRGQIDTGTLVTGVGPAVLRSLGAVPGGSIRTQTASGTAVVRLYRMSFTIFDPTAAATTTLSRADWVVTNLPQDLPDVEVLFGMDLIRELVMHVDGPAGAYSLES
jgi:hypothetical protein